MVARSDEGKQGFRATVSRAFNQVALAGLASCDERTSRKDLFQDELVVDRQSGRQGANDYNGTESFLHTLSRVAGGMTSSPSGGMNQNIWGSQKFKLTVDQVTTTGSDGGVQLLAQAKSHSGYDVPINCSWKRQFGNVNQPCNNASTTYLISADDIGASIMLEAHAEDDLGTAYAKFGPFSIDPHLSRQLDSITQADGTEIPFDIHSNISADDKNSLPGKTFDTMKTYNDGDGLIVINGREIGIKKKTAGGRVTNEANGRFSGEYPTIFTKGMRGFALRLNDSTLIRGECSSRSQRDLLVMAIRIFQGRFSIGFATMMEFVSRQHALEMTNREAKKIVDSAEYGELPAVSRNELTNNMMNLTMYIQRILSMLNETTAQLTTEKTKCRKCMKERDDLQEELEATISAYQSMIANMEDQKDEPEGVDDDRAMIQKNSNQPTRADAACANCADNENKLIELRAVNEQYKKETEAIRSDLRDMNDRFARILKAGEDDRRNRSMLEMKSREELHLSNAQVFDYKKKNEELMSKLARMEKERDDDKKKFLYTKEKLDELIAANKRLELDKTKFMDSTRHGFSSDETTEALRTRVQDLETENNALRNKIRRLAQA